MKPKTLKISRLIILFLAILLSATSRSQVITWNNQVFKVDTLADHLGFPWEITYGPDDSLWVTESRGYKVTKVNAITGGKRTILNLANNKDFNRPDISGGQWPQGGLMGLALHPKLLTGKPYVYLAYVYQFDNCLSNNDGCFFWTRVVRYTYNLANKSLGSPIIMLDGLPGSNDHNSGRMTIGPDNFVPGDTSKFKLYYTIGDMGAGQFTNQNRTNNAQNLNVYEGKILRLNLEPDASQSGGDEWIPDNNPYPVGGPVTNKTAVYSYGHRNPQGVQWGSIGGVHRLYSSEHGDKSDDEVNIINMGVNYGWPRVAGLCDDNYNTFDGNGNNNMLANQTVPNEIVSFCNGTPNQQPMFSLFNASAASIPSSGANIFTWPTVAPSSIDFYKDNYSNTIPGWRNSIIVTSLKYGMFRLKLKQPGDRVDSNSTGSITDTIAYFHGNRIRDIAINPHGDTLYFAIDSSGSTSGPTGGFNGGSVGTANAGRILRAVYLVTLASTANVPDNPVNNRTYVRVYPNPASRILYIQGKRGMHKPLRVELWDMTGKLSKLASSSKDNFSIGLDGLAKGMYILKLYDGVGVLMTTEKVIIQ